MQQGFEQRADDWKDAILLLQLCSKMVLKKSAATASNCQPCSVVTDSRLVRRCNLNDLLQMCKMMVVQQHTLVSPPVADDSTANECKEAIPSGGYNCSKNWCWDPAQLHIHTKGGAEEGMNGFVSMHAIAHCAAEV